MRYNDRVFPTGTKKHPLSIIGVLQPELVEDLLFEYEENIQNINELCAYDIRANHTEKPFFDDEHVNNTAIQQFTNEARVLNSQKFQYI